MTMDVKGFSATERIGIAVVNPRGAARLSVIRPVILRRLISDRPAGSMTAEAVHLGGGAAEIALITEDGYGYGTQRAVETLGTYDLRTRALLRPPRKEDEYDLLDEVRHLPEWAAFLKELEEAVLAADVMMT